MIRGVVFDVGGTMHVSQKDPKTILAFSQTVLSLLAQNGMDILLSPEDFYEQLMKNSEAYKALSEQTGRELPPLAIWRDHFLKGFPVNETRLASLAEELCDLYDGKRMKLDPRPHLLETVEQLHQVGLAQGVISNIISRNFVPGILRHYGIDRYMSCVILSSQVGMRKPWPHMFRLAEEQLGLSARELAYVGDTISRDVLGVRNAGWRLMIQIKNPGVKHRDERVKDKGYEPDYLIEDLAEIPAIITRENVK